MGVYCELCKLFCGVSIVDEFDECVEVVCVVVDSGDFVLYISVQGGVNVLCDCQIVRVVCSLLDEVNEYEEEVERVVGIYVLYFGVCYIYIIRMMDWCIVLKVLVVEFLILKSGIVVFWSFVNNCGKFIGGDILLLVFILIEYVVVVLNFIDEGILSWIELGIMKVFRDLLSNELKCSNCLQQSFIFFNG